MSTCRVVSTARSTPRAVSSGTRATGRVESIATLSTRFVVSITDAAFSILRVVSTAGITVGGLVGEANRRTACAPAIETFKPQASAVASSIVRCVILVSWSCLLSLPRRGRRVLIALEPSVIHV